MARYKISYKLQLTDINGDVAEVVINAAALDTATLAGLAANMATIESAVAAASNAKVTRQSVSALFNEAQFLIGSTPPTNAEYSSVTDGARFQFADGAGDRGSITIPAPVEAMFGANSNVIDPTNGLAAGIITVMETFADTSSGTVLNLYKGGVKVGRGARRRRSSLVP
jgi:hypothetical protein